jgi:purine-binding chemotaxis protein CheW
MIIKTTRNATATRFLTFWAAGKQFCVKFQKVHGVINSMGLIPTLHHAKLIRGVIELNGNLIPVVDLRLKMGMASVEPPAQSGILIVKAHGTEIGIIAEDLPEVQAIAPEDIHYVPSTQANVDSDWIRGICRDEDRIKFLIDTDKLLPFLDGEDHEVSFDFDPNYFAIQRFYPWAQSIRW